ncbi:hypothetical protein [Blastomonas fulva]|jgi:hypothetical protein|uniref:hypothetical protein n=1 Tax=Blastomonas fulva TaxID=1550728 RepID=UPI003D267ABD
MARKPPLIELRHPIKKKLFRKIEKAVRKAGYGKAIKRSENMLPPADADQFAAEAIYVLCNSGFSNRVAVPIFEQCMLALRGGHSTKTVFGHPGKTDAMDYVWSRRRRLFRAYLRADDKIEFCATLPWIGPVTKFHLAKNFGADVAKPDVHLNRLAEAEGTTAQLLCERLARQTGYRIATIDSILWKAAEQGLIRPPRK